MMEPLGILHLTTFLQGGAGRAITDLACAQHAAGHRVTVVTSETGNADFGNYREYLERLRAAGVTLYMCDSLFTRDLALNMRVAEMLWRAADVKALDVIHAHAAVPAFIGRLFVDGANRVIPIIQTQHGWGINKTPDQATFDVDVLRAVDKVVTTSRATADLLVDRGVPASSIWVIPCGLPADKRCAPPVEAVHALQPFLARGARVAGCIGSVTANKNQRLLVEALPLVPDLDLVVALIGEGSEGLVEYARELGVANRVVACGYQARAARWLPLFDVLVVPSRTEGQGLVVLEAFRAGVPVVASRIPALAELIETGKNGLLFEGDDAAALGEAMRRLFSLRPAERDALVRAGLARFAADFTVQQMIARHARLYRDVVGAALQPVRH